MKLLKELVAEQTLSNAKEDGSHFNVHVFELLQTQLCNGSGIMAVFWIDIDIYVLLLPFLLALLDASG